MAGGEYQAGMKFSRRMSLPWGHRSFHELPKLQSHAETQQSHIDGNLFSYIEENVIGKDKVFSGPFGLRKAVYCDYTASGRSLHFLEDFIRDEVLPDYGNTHTTNTVTSLQTTLFRHEARDIIRNAVNAGVDDAVLFVGSGTTGAVHKMIGALNLVAPPVVFVGPFEHHSNLLPWREIGSHVVRIRETPEGLVDVVHLKAELQKWQGSGFQLIGSFAAASNITGTLVDADTITICLHEFGALAFWDYATAAPYVCLDMNPLVRGDDRSLAHKDAMFISSHKFVGGVQTPGLLIAKKCLFCNPVPSSCGGGTVFFVRREAHRYLQEVETREEGGTPAIVESIRTGLVFQLKQAVGAENIMEREHDLCRRAFSRWTDVTPLLLLGSPTAPRLPVFSFLIRHEQSGYLLHHNYICSVLNDLFGLQTRAGCACAGPYAEDLLGIGESLAEEIEALLLADSRLDKEFSDHECLRPGFVRLNFPYFLNDDTIDFILQAVAMVAEHGWKLLPQYNFNPKTGEWRHRDHVFRDRKWLGGVTYRSQGRMTFRQPVFQVKGPLPSSYQECLQKAVEIFAAADRIKVHIGEQAAIFDEASERMRWFLLPSDALLWLHDPTAAAATRRCGTMPFEPTMYPKTDTVNHFANGVMANDVDIKCKMAPQVDVNEVHVSVGIRENAPCVGMVTLPVEHSEVYTSDTELDASNVDISAGSHTIVDNSQSSSDNGLDIDEHDHLGLDMQSSDQQADGQQRSSGRRKDGHCWHVPSKAIFRPALQALQQFDMVQDKDRVLICLSGGKDSLSLLHMMRQYQFYCRNKGVNFEFGAVTIDPESPSYDPRPLKKYLAELNVPYFYEEQCILQSAHELPYECASICSFCSRMKRGRIYACARREGYNVLALGQHLDDLSESFLMSVFYNGTLRTMKSHYTVQEGDLRVIRPFVFVRERDLQLFAEQNNLPVISENCPACFEAPKERQRVKQMLASQELLHDRLFHSIQSAITPIMDIRQTGVNVKSLLQQQCRHSNDTCEKEDG